MLIKLENIGTAECTPFLKNIWTVILGFPLTRYLAEDTGGFEDISLSSATIFSCQRKQAVNDVDQQDHQSRGNDAAAVSEGV